MTQSAPPVDEPFSPPPDTIRVGGHFGELLQGRLGADGPLALVSLPCPALFVEIGDTQGREITYPPNWLPELSVQLDLPAPAMPPVLRATMTPGAGAGASTASLVALARAMGYAGGPERLAKACRAIEGASDPLMHPAPERLLFAPREARILRNFAPLPAFEVVGGFWGAPQRTDPSDVDFPDIADLVADWFGLSHLAHMAELASESARRTLAHRGPADDPTEDLARDLGALGWCTAHTGSARGLIFAPGLAPPRAAQALVEAGFEQILHFSAGGTHVA